MFKSIKTLKDYYKIANVKFYLILLEFIALLIPSVLSVASPILSANVISAITVYDYDSAIFQLTLDFLIILISAVSYFIYHLISTKVNKIFVLNFQNYVYNNVKENKNINKISLSIINNIWECANFNKTLLYKLCFFIKAILILCIVIYHTLYIGLAIITVSIITFLLLRFTDSKIQKHDSNFSKFQSQSLELFNSIRQGQNKEQNTIVENTLKEKYFGYVENTIKTNNRMSLYYSINNNFISLILKGTIFAITIYIITLIKSTTLTLSLYLILTPYLTSSAQNLISFFELFSSFGTIENILFDFKALKYQTTEPNEEKIEFSTYNLNFFKVSVKDKSRYLLSDFSLNIQHKDSIAFIGDLNKTNQVLFNLIQKKIKPTSGSILLDNKNTSDISLSEYDKLVFCTTSRPYFYNVSIFENLYLVCKNKTKIIKTLRMFNLKGTIDMLPNNINQIVEETFNDKLLYFLGITRAYLSGAKIICIYGIPNNFDKEDYDNLNKILEYIKIQCTIIFFDNKISNRKLFTNIIYIDKK